MDLRGFVSFPYHYAFYVRFRKNSWPELEDVCKRLVSSAHRRIG